jgi:hypothetical protein
VSANDRWVTTLAARAGCTLIATAKLNHVDPQAWLADVLTKVLDYSAKRVGDLQPWNRGAEHSAVACSLASKTRRGSLLGSPVTHI